MVTPKWPVQAGETHPCLADVSVNAFPINSPDSKLRDFIFPETSQVRPCGFSMAETSCSQLMFCQAVFFPKPSQEKTHKYSYKQVTYFPADMHFAFCYFHSIFPTHRLCCYRESSLYEKIDLAQPKFFQQNLSKSLCGHSFHWRLEYFYLM